MPIHQHRIIELYAKSLSKEATNLELEELTILLKEDENEQFFHKLISNWWQIQDSKLLDAETDKDDHFNHILTKAKANQATPVVKNIPPNTSPIINRTILIRWSIGVAALFIGLMVGIQFGLFDATESNTNKNSYNEIVARKGTKSKLILPDGSQVWLNSESKLSYSLSFNDSVREVLLEGEAYFDIVNDKNRPFIVKTSAINIRVLGTAFNVKSYKEDPTIETTLVRGLIEVHNNSEPSASKIILKPNEKLVFNKTEATFTQQEGDRAAKENKITQIFSISTLSKLIPDSAREETSWVYGRLVFDGDSFVELAQKMERWYNKKIIIKNKKLLNTRFGGVFEDESVEEALRALQLITMFKYTIYENEIIIE